MVSSSLAEGHIIFREGRVGRMEGGGGGKEEVAWRDGGRADARGEMRGRRWLSTSVLVQTRIELLVQDSHWLGGHMCLNFHWTGPSLSASHLHPNEMEKT